MKMNVEYIKDYKYKELKQYVLAYLLIAVASVGFYIKDTIDAVGLLSALSSKGTVVVGQYHITVTAS